MYKYSGTSALRNVRNNPHADWSGATSEDPGKLNSAANRIRSPFFRCNPRLSFDLKKEDGVFAIGSCFAREIEASLIRDGFNILSYDSKIMREDIFCGPRLSSRHEFLNRYNLPSMILEVQRLLGKDINSSLIDFDNKTDLHFANSCYTDREELIHERRAATRAYGEGLKAAGVVIITLGLSEVWFDAEGLPLNSTPNPRVLRGSDCRYNFRFLSVDENITYLRDLHSLLVANNPTAQVVVTVSPVPLQTTFTTLDVVEANSLAKSILLVAARTFVEEHENVHYFPSYEIVMNSHPDIAWKGDKKHVKPEVVDFIVSTFKHSVGIQ